MQMARNLHEIFDKQNGKTKQLAKGTAIQTHTCTKNNMIQADIMCQSGTKQ